MTDHAEAVAAKDLDYSALLEAEPAEEEQGNEQKPQRAMGELWQARAMRYMGIYLLLSVAVLGLRYATRDTYPQLRELRREVSELQTQRDTLELEVQQLTTGPRILNWAKQSGMIPYAQARKQSQGFQPLPAPPTPMPSTQMDMSTRWHP